MLRVVMAAVEGKQYTLLLCCLTDYFHQSEFLSFLLLDPASLFSFRFAFLMTGFALDNLGRAVIDHSPLWMTLLLTCQPALYCDATSRVPRSFEQGRPEAEISPFYSYLYTFLTSLGTISPWLGDCMTNGVTHLFLLFTSHHCINHHNWQTKRMSPSET